MLLLHLAVTSRRQTVSFPRSARQGLPLQPRPLTLLGARSPPFPAWSTAASPHVVTSSSKPPVH